MSGLTFGFTKQQILTEKRTNEEEIGNVRQWLRAHAYPALMDEQIIPFLISCCNDLELTKKTIKSCYSLKQSAPEVFAFNSVDNEDFKGILDVVYCFPLPVKTNDNFVILVIRLKDADYRNFDSCSGCKLNVMVVESIVQEYPPSGLLVLLDVCNVSLMHITKVKIDIMKIYLNYIQDSMPLRLIAVYIFNSGLVIQAFLNIARPFLKANILDKLHFCNGNLNLDDLARMKITKELLPMDYGGNLQSLDFYQESMVSRLRELQPFFQAEVEQWIHARFDDDSAEFS